MVCTIECDDPSGYQWDDQALNGFLESVYYQQNNGSDNRLPPEEYATALKEELSRTKTKSCTQESIKWSPLVTRVPFSLN
jgi:hypothetical protein